LTKKTFPHPVVTHEAYHHWVSSGKAAQSAALPEEMKTSVSQSEDSDGTIIY
jgi:hypothetical protein